MDHRVKPGGDEEAASLFEITRARPRRENEIAFFTSPRTRGEGGSYASSREYRSEGRATALEHVPQKWQPVLRKRTRSNK